MDFRPIDADNHYYESLAAFTRHLDPKMRRRGVQVLGDGKRRYVVIADKINRFIANPTFDPVVVPGCNDLMFRGQAPAGVDPRSLQKLGPIRAEYQDREARLRVMDEQGLAAVLLFPTLGVGVEEGLRDDPDATMACLSAFNRWLEEDWGFSYRDRIFAVPMLSLADPQAAVAELESLLGRGARIIHIRPAPVPSASGPRSLGHRDHDPVWARLAGSGGRQRLSPVHRHGVGRASHLRAVLCLRRSRRRPCRRSGDLRHNGVADRAWRILPPSHFAGRQHRERLGLDPPFGQTAAEKGQPGPIGVPRGSGRCASP